MKKFSALLMALVLLMTMMVGTAFAEEKKGKITWLCSSTAEQLTGYQVLLDRFTAETGIDNEIIASDYEQLYPKLQAMIAANQVPEVASWGTEFVPWAGRGAMTPLDDYIAEGGVDLSLFEEGALDSMRWDGKLWQLPYTVNTCILYYNEELFAAAGLATPTTDWNDKSWTLEAFVDLAQKLTLDGEGRNAQDANFDANNIVQFGVGGMQAWWFYPWYFGGDWTNQEATEYTGNTEAAQQGVQAVYDLIHKYHVMPTVSQNEAFASGGNTFMTGKVAMTVDGSWATSSYKEAPFKWNIAASPIGTQHSIVLFTDGFGIGGRSTDPDSMWEFLKWFYGDVNNVMEFFAAANGYLCIPAFKPAKDLIRDKIIEAFPDLNVDVLMNAVAVPEATPVWMRYNLNWNQIDTTISNEAIDSIRTGDATAAEKMSDPDFIDTITEIITTVP